MKKILKNKFGFTLIEIVISIAILGVFISLVFGTIFYVNKLNESVVTSSNIQNNVKSAFDSMILSINTLGINYNYYKVGNSYNIPIPINNIVLNNTIYKKIANCYSTFSCIEVSFDNGATYQNITMQDTNVSNLSFYFLPPNVNSMPIITIDLSGYTQDSHKKNYSFSYQNTVEIKNYIK